MNKMEKEERMICSIVADAKDGKIPSHEECFWTMLALSSMFHFARRDLESIAEAMDKGKNLERVCEMHLSGTNGVRETYYKWMRSTPKKWLGDSGNPFSEESKKWRDMGRKIIKNATGIDL
jgi:hypothetical protein